MPTDFRIFSRCSACGQVGKTASNLEFSYPQHPRGCLLLGAYCRTRGELREQFSVEQAVQYLFTVFYGAFLTAQLYGAEDIYDFYEAHLRIIAQQSAV